jgi:hypothetical protein
MTEVDALELAATFTGNSFTSFAIFISFTFGFLATAFFVGSKLTRFQALAAAGGYLVSAGAMASACVAWLQAFVALKNSKATFLDTIPLFNGDVWVPGSSFILILGMAISLYFMWDVRRPKTE